MPEQEEGITSRRAELLLREAVAAMIAIILPV
jgi:hypothetical protein